MKYIWSDLGHDIIFFLNQKDLNVLSISKNSMFSFFEKDNTTKCLLDKNTKLKNN